MNTLLSIRDCARQLGVAAHRIAYAHDTGKLRDVRRRVAGKRIYTPKDVQRVADYFGVEFKPDQDRDRRKKVGELDQQPESYTYRRTGTTGCEVLDATETIVAWTPNEWWATNITRSLNESDQPCLSVGQVWSSCPNGS